MARLFIENSIASGDSGAGEGLDDFSLVLEQYLCRALRRHQDAEEAVPDRPTPLGRAWRYEG